MSATFHTAAAPLIFADIDVDYAKLSGIERAMKTETSRRRLRRLKREKEMMLGRIEACEVELMRLSGDGGDEEIVW